MRVISKRPLLDFASRYPDSEMALLAWHKIIECHSPRSFPEMRSLLGSVDKVGDLHVFEIRGNRYRLICSVSYRTQTCYVKHVLTHAEYDRGFARGRHLH